MSRYPFSAQTKSLIEIADKFFYSSQRKEAIINYNQALTIEPDCVYALVQRGLALQEEGQVEAAMSDYNLALELDPQYGPAYYGRGWAKSWLQDYSGELEDARKGLEFDPDNPGMYLRRIATALSGLNQFDEAIKVYSQAIDLNPNNEGTIYNRALCYLQMAQFESAIKDLDRVITLDSDWAWAYYHRGIAYDQLGNTEQASKDIDLAVHYDPSYEQAIQAQQILKKNQTSMVTTSPTPTGGSKIASTLHIIQIDYMALLGFLFPFGMWGFYLVLWILGNIDPSDLTLPIIFAFITLLSVMVLIWRVQTINNIFADGLEAVATINNISFFRDRGRVDYVYTFQGQKYVGGNAIHKVKKTQSLQIGEQVIVMVDRNNPKQAYIRDLYL